MRLKVILAIQIHGIPHPLTIQKYLPIPPYSSLNPSKHKASS